MSNIIKFFKENPEELKKLIPEQKKSQFFDKIREIAISNSEKGDEVTLTKNQIVDLCVEMNSKSAELPNIKSVIYQTPFGEFSLN